ncbi:MAG: SCP2 sterol-binding domain-containing protein [Promethearchaeota archaeon]
MATSEDLKTQLSKWVKKFDDPSIAVEFEGFNKTMQFTFPDINYHLKLIIANKTARLEEGIDNTAAMGLEANSDLFLGILKEEIDPMEAFIEGELKVKGDLNALQKLEFLMS